MAKQIIVVGMYIPGEIEIEDEVSYGTRRSLLDADIVLFESDVREFISSHENFQGKKSLYEHDSFRLKEASAHWKSQMLATIEAGKTVFAFMKHYESVYIQTGRREYSGTGRNRRTTNIVDEHSPYSDIPTNLGKVVHSPGTRIKIAPGAEVVLAYWSEFGRYTGYDVYFDGIKAIPLLVTQNGEKVVGALVTSKSGGFLVLLPLPDFDQAVAAIEERASPAAVGDGADEDEEVGDIAAVEDVEKEEAEPEFSAAENSVGSKFISAIVEIDRALRASRARTPMPSWAKEGRYDLIEERGVRLDLDRVAGEIKSLETSRTELHEKLIAAGSLRGLLFETGHQLEDAIIEALRTLGFTANKFKEGQSEFDAVFVSPEGGRFLGEAEGKDNKAVNIDKMDQLERNIREEFAAREGTEYAKGVLFGNANRLAPLADRGEYFTAKCTAAASRSGVALVRTPDLFEAARYVKEQANEDFARRCRDAILNTSGAIVRFPDIPVDPESPAKAAQA
jgi:hypothetical protein